MRERRERREISESKGREGGRDGWRENFPEKVLCIQTQATGSQMQYGHRDAGTTEL